MKNNSKIIGLIAVIAVVVIIFSVSPFKTSFLPAVHSPNFYPHQSYSFPADTTISTWTFDGTTITINPSQVVLRIYESTSTDMCQPPFSGYCLGAALFDWTFNYNGPGGYSGSSFTFPEPGSYRLEWWVYQTGTYSGGGSWAALQYGDCCYIKIPDLTPRTLTINTNPPGATVAVTGIDTKISTNGVASFTVVDGSYPVTVSKESFNTQTTTVVVAGDTSVTITLVTTPTITVITNPTNCDVTINSVDKKNSGDSGVAVLSGGYIIGQTYPVSISHSGPDSHGIYYDGVSTSVPYTGGNMIHVNLPVAKFTATIYPIFSSKANDMLKGCTVTLSNATYSNTITASSTGYNVAFGGLYQGTYTVVVSKAGYYPTTGTITVPGGSRNAYWLTLNVLKFDFFITTTPNYCDVTLSGMGTVNSGVSGLATFTDVPTNSYTLTVSKTGYHTSVTSIVINSEESITINLQP